MSDVHQQLLNIEHLSKKLASKNREVAEKNAQLAAEKAELENALKAKEDEIRKLKSELNGLRLARGFSGNAEEAQMARAKINSLMREIDRCIALLND